VLGTKHITLIFLNFFPACFNLLFPLSLSFLFLIFRVCVILFRLLFFLLRLPLRFTFTIFKFSFYFSIVFFNHDNIARSLVSDGLLALLAFDLALLDLLNGLLNFMLGVNTHHLSRTLCHVFTCDLLFRSSVLCFGWRSPIFVVWACVVLTFVNIWNCAVWKWMAWLGLFVDHCVFADVRVILFVGHFCWQNLVWKNVLV
jgi:hypothetical protein